MQSAPPKGRTGCPRGEGLSVGGFPPTDQMDTGAHLVRKGHGRGESKRAYGVGSAGRRRLESVTFATLSAYSLVRNAEGSVQSPSREWHICFLLCVFCFFFNTLCHPPLRSFTTTRQVAALLNSKRSQRNG